MLSFASGAICRHRFLVEHFGERWADDHAEGGARSEGGSSSKCGACDVCLDELARADDGLVVAQKILSCVVRCEQRFGASHVADVLRGADSEKVRQRGHDALTTFGLMKDSSSREIRHFIDQLVAQAHLAVADGEYPTLSVTASGREILRGTREPALFRLPKPAKTSRKSLARIAYDVEGAAADEGLFEALRQLRRRLAHERGVPPYIIFNDRTLAELAARKPATPEEFRSVKGVGDKKATELGPAFLAAIAEFAAAAPPDFPSSQPGATAGSPPRQPI
jgi:ATP-dependent DNA helicase RecQ